MKIKKYEAESEQEAIEKVKEELGLSALVLNIKKTQPKGLFAFFRKPLVEVTAAYDDGVNDERKREIKKPPAQALTTPVTMRNDAAASKPINKAAESAAPGAFLEEIRDILPGKPSTQRIAELEMKLTSTEDLLEKVIGRLTIAEQRNHSGRLRKYENNMLQIFYDTFLEQGIDAEIAEKLLEDVDSVFEDEKININLIVKIVYNTIINVLGAPEPIRPEKNKTGNAKVIAFIGPTGVGKTTTIAKLSSNLILQGKMRVGLITADTYRIAAVEQLKTYAEILGLQVGVVYNGDELRESIDAMNGANDFILIDTAGRSHKNNENVSELSELLQYVPNCEIYLVMSITTKCEDLMNIVSTYAAITDFKIIFTKLDETVCLGSILNVCYRTGKKVSYLTNGQNVPDDIEIIKPDKITRTLLGMGGEASNGSGQ